MSHGCARCSSPSNRCPCPASCRLAEPGVQQGTARLTEPGGFVGPAHEGPHPACPLLAGVHLGCAQVTGCNSPHGFPLLKRCIGLFLHLFITVAFPSEATLAGRAELAGQPLAWAPWEVVPSERGNTPPRVPHLTPVLGINLPAAVLVLGEGRLSSPVSGPGFLPQGSVASGTPGSHLPFGRV